MTFDSSSSTLRIFDAVGSRGLVYEASKNEPATVNHLGEEDFQSAQSQERSLLVISGKEKAIALRVICNRVGLTLE